MPPIKSILDKYKDDFGQVVSKLCVDTIENRRPVEYNEEYDGERRRRKASVGWREPKRLEQYPDILKDGIDNSRLKNDAQEAKDLISDVENQEQE